MLENKQWCESPVSPMILDDQTFTKSVELGITAKLQWRNPCAMMKILIL